MLISGIGDGSLRISPSCWDLLRETSRRSPTLALTDRPYLHTYIRKPRRPTRSGCNDRRDVPTILEQSSRHRTADTHSRILYSLTFPPLPSFLNSEWLQNYDVLRGGGLALEPSEGSGATQLPFADHGSIRDPKSPSGVCGMRGCIYPFERGYP